MKRLIFLFFLCSVFFDSYCQYKAPIFTCVTRKTSGGASNEIEWKDPNETCGAFQKFDIYAATNKAGPFNLLTSISNIATTSYNHTGIIANNTYYYYMTSSYNCPGVSNFSDTLSDSLMPYPKLLAISIENNFPVYKWKPVLDQKKIWAYVLINFGSSFVDTIIGREKTEYIDSSFLASSGVYTGHLVGSISSCGEKGFSPPIYRHRPVFLSLASNPCEDEVELSWTKYQGWGPNDDVKKYEIYVKKNSGPELLVGTNDTSSKTFRYKEFLFGDTLCIRVKSFHPTEDEVFSYSNQLCFISSKSQVPELLQPLSASYIDKSIVKIRWYCSPDAIPKSFDLLKIDPKSGNVLRARDKIKFISEGAGYFYFIDSFGELTRAIDYRIRFEDLCNNKSEGGQIQTNFMTINQIGLYKTELRWPKNYFKDSILYSKLKLELYFSLDGNSFSKIAELNHLDLRFEHLVENQYQTDGKFCYKLVITYKFDTLKPINDSIYLMESPIQCIDMRTVLWMPNAFKINGVTPVFKPKMYFFNSTVFNMKIFNRWGVQVFETNDPNQGWNGIMDNGQLASEDSYVYLVSYLGNDKAKVEKTGTFTLIK